MVYKKRAEEIERAMKTVSTTESSSTGTDSRRQQNERRNEKLVAAQYSNNQIVENFDNRGDSSRSAANYYGNNDPVASPLKQDPPQFTNNVQQPTETPRNEQKSTPFILQVTTRPPSDQQNYQGIPSDAQYGNKLENQNSNLNVPVASHNYQQLPTNDFNNPPNYQTSGAGNTNYKFSYTVNTPSKSRLPSASQTKQDFTNNQVFSQQSSAPVEKERQIPAETASFASNRHRYNQFDQTYYQNTYVATPSTTSTENYQSTNSGNGNKGPSASTSYTAQPSAHSTKSAQSSRKTTTTPQTQNFNTGPSILNTFAAQANQNNFGDKNQNAGKAANPDNGKSRRKLQNSFFQQYNPNVAQFGRNPPNSRGSFNQVKTMSSVISSLPTTVTVPSSSQVYNSHMQPYTSFNPNSNQAGNNQYTNAQGTFSTWPSTPSSAASTLPSSSPGQEYFQEVSSSQQASNSYYNGLTTGRGSQQRDENKYFASSTVKPYRSKPIFNVKIRPNKDYSLLELHRQNPTNTPATQLEHGSATASGYSPTSSPQYETTGPARTTLTLLQSPALLNSASQTFAGYETVSSFSPTSSATDLRSTTPAHKYATVNITGTPEEIRPEIVNGLMDPGIRPTSANALLTFANYYNSAETKDGELDEYRTTLYPHVSDVVLNLGSTGKEEYTYSTVKPITSTNGNDLPAELSENTKDSYSFLFSDKKEQYSQNNYDLTPKESGSIIPNLNKASHKQFAKEFLRNKQKTTETSTARPETTTHKLRDSAELRELAQVFSRALSAYLEDPETFKEILAQVRPTEPNPSDLTTPSPDDEVLDFSDASQTRTGTTEPPVTPLITSNDVTGDVSIGDINNLVHSKDRSEIDTSYETNSISPSSIHSIIANIEFTTQAPPTVLPELSSAASAASSDYYTKLGSAEDTSYFPTAGGVDDDSRPRYGGFHNNTRRLPQNYSPYGADLKRNTTQNPGPLRKNSIKPFLTTVPSYTTTTSPTPDYTTILPPQQASSILPGAQQVNNLIASHKALYETSAQFSSSSEEDKDGTASGSNEKLLQTSGSQSLVSSQNYAAFAENFNKNGLKQFGKDAFGGYVPSAVVGEPSAISNDFFKADLLPYFGQEPPFETFSQPAAFQTQTPHFGDRIVNFSNMRDAQTYVDNLAGQNPNSFTQGSNQYRGANVISDRMGYDVTAAGTESTASPTAAWTVSPYETTQFVSSSSNVEVTPELSSTTVVKPTTYHPHHSSQEPTTTVDPTQFETTTATWQDTTTTEEPAVYQTTTLAPDQEEESSMMQAKANEMFGMLNETASTMLMHVMSMAENNMTLRRLVLLLVNDPNKQKTDEQSRISLINALLTHENEIEEYTTQAPQATTTASKRKVLKTMRALGSGRSLKLQRGLDNETAVHGTHSIRNVTEDLNKANAAKLYIPSRPAAIRSERLQASSTTTVSSSSSSSVSSSSSAAATALPVTTTLPYDSDARALELLKTLYNLAAKWG